MRLQRDGFSIEAAIEKGRTLPDWYLEEPILLPGEEFYLKAFFHLSSCRSSGMTPGAIPWDKCVDYGLHAGLDGDMLDLFVDIIKAVDAKYMAWQASEEAKARQASMRDARKGTGGRQRARKG